MNALYAIIISFFAGISTLIGGLFIFIPISKKNINKFITLSLAFSISIMIGISIFDLLPQSIITIASSYKYSFFPLITSLFLLSYFLIKLIVKLLKKYENNLYKLGILSMITLMIHNLPEGIITFLSSYTDISLGIKLSIAIALHNIPEGICIALPIYYSTGSKFKALSRAFISGLSEPLGALLAYLFLAKFITDNMIAFILVIVSGLMITLALEQMFPETIKYKEKKYLLLGFILGIILILINVFFL